MIYMIIFWILVLVEILLYITFKKKRLLLEKISTPLLLLAVAFLIVAIVTKDPLFSAFGVPPEFEWIVGLFITGLSSWKLYFSPLKERIIHTEKEVVSVKSDLTSIKIDTTLIKEFLYQKKP